MNILLLDGGKAFGHSHGELNHTLHKNFDTMSKKL
ncbi:NADPH quinone reductase [Haemophilus aegyptius]|nr:NADPH quinone reductase [Haemophilus aegyptius]